MNSVQAGLWFLVYMYGFAGVIATLAIPLYFISKRFF